MNSHSILKIIVASSAWLMFLSQSVSVGGSGLADREFPSSDAPLTQQRPKVQFRVSSQSITEQDTGINIIVSIIVQLDVISTLDVLVSYDVSGTAVDGIDYAENTGGSLVIPAGDLSADIRITVIGDDLYEADETVVLSLGTPTNADLGTRDRHTATIVDDDDAPSLSFSAADYTVNENQSAQITVLLSPPAGRTVTVNYATHDPTSGSKGVAGEDYIAANGTLTFFPGQTSKSFSVTILDDALDEDQEQVWLTLTSPNPGEVQIDGFARLFINDNDPSPIVGFSSAIYTVDEDGGTATIQVTLDTVSGRTVTVDYETSPATATEWGDYRPAAGTLTFDPGQTSKSFAVTIIDDNVNENDREELILTLSNPSNVNLGVAQAVLRILDDDSSGLLYVKPSASGDASCSDWDNACTLQTALGSARIGDEIWVAQGVHTPGVGRADTFQLKSGVAVYGGFAAIETARSQRGWGAHPTVLSGDIDNNDLTDPHGVLTTTTHISGSNSYHVVTGSGVDATAVLDGFTITGGDANGAYLHDSGSEMTNLGGKPTLTNGTFSGNSASYGGGMYNSGGKPMLTDVTFSGNAAELGGGMYNSGGKPTLTDVTFSGNSASWGGGMRNFSSNPELTNVTFSGNSARYGGGICNSSSSPWLVNVAFSGNSATDSGGGITNLGGNPALMDVSFSGNSAVLGGGMFNSSSSPSLTNVSFSGNSARDDGGGMFNYDSSATLANCILAGNNDGGTDEQEAQIFNIGSIIAVSYSLVAGGVYTGTGNISADPLFVRDPDPGDSDWITLGDNDYGDLRLQLTSPAIDAGDNTAVPAGVITDLDGKPRFVDMPDRPDTGVGPAPIVDMGAYEAQMRFVYLPLALRNH